MSFTNLSNSMNGTAFNDARERKDLSIHRKVIIRLEGILLQHAFIIPYIDTLHFKRVAYFFLNSLLMMYDDSLIMT
jgi:hypothetical protein